VSEVYKSECRMRGKSSLEGELIFPDVGVHILVSYAEFRGEMSMVQYIID